MSFTVSFQVATQTDAIRAAQDLLRVQPLIDAVTVRTPDGLHVRVVRDGESFKAEPVLN